MLTDVVAAGTKALGGARFSLVSILPGTLFVAIILLAAFSGAYGSGEASLLGITEAADVWGPGGAVLLVFGLFLAGVLLQPFQVALVQYLEGYWSRGPVHTLSTERHRRRLRTAAVEQRLSVPDPPASDLRAGADSARAFALVARRRSRASSVVLRYPADPTRVMPTMLGNILRNGEDAAGDRYCLDAMTVYPRLYPSISPQLSAAMTRQLDMITTTASLTVSCLAAALATSPLLVVRRDLWVLLPLGAALLALVSYRGALRAAADHGVLFATVFDLHRFDMVRALHHRLPTGVAEEFALNDELTDFFQDRRPPEVPLADRPYDHSVYDAPAPGPPAGGPQDGGSVSPAAPGEPAPGSAAGATPTPGTPSG